MWLSHSSKQNLKSNNDHHLSQNFRRKLDMVNLKGSKAKLETENQKYIV